MKNYTFLYILKKFWQIDKKYVILFFIGKIKDVPRPLMYSLCTKFIIDILTYKDSYNKIVILLLNFMIFEGFMTFYNAWMNDKYCREKNEKISTILVTDFLRKIQYIPLKNFERNEFSSKNLLAIEEISQTYFNLFVHFADIIVSTLSIISLIMCVFVINKYIIFFSIIVLIIYFLVNAKVNKIKTFQQIAIISFERNKRYFSKMFNNCEDIKNMRINMSEDFFISKYIKNSNAIIKEIKNKSHNIALYVGLSNNLFTIFQYLVMAFTSYMVLTNKITIGSFSAVLQAIITFINQIRHCSEIIVQMSRYYSNFKIIFDIDRYVYVPPTNKRMLVLDRKRAHTIEFKKLNFFFDKHQIFKDLSFIINPGEKVALIGENGTGKSTLLNLLLRLIEPEDNSIFIDGIDIKKYDLQSFRENFSVVLQNQINYPITVAESMLINSSHKHLEENRLNNCLKASLIYDKICKQNKGIFSSITKILDDEGIVFSGGENQRFNISKFFNKNAPILILYEYEKWLDENSNKIIFKNIMNFAKNKTLIIVTHNKNILPKMDKVILLDQEYNK